MYSTWSFMTKIDCAHLKFDVIHMFKSLREWACLLFQNELKLPSYPLYHSKYETFKAVDEFMDRGFKVSVVYFCEHVVNCPTHTIQPTQQLTSW